MEMKNAKFTKVKSFLTFLVKSLPDRGKGQDSLAGLFSSKTVFISHAGYEVRCWCIVLYSIFVCLTYFLVNSNKQGLK